MLLRGFSLTSSSLGTTSHKRVKADLVFCGFLWPAGQDPSPLEVHVYAHLVMSSDRLSEADRLVLRRALSIVNSSCGGDDGGGTTVAEGARSEPSAGGGGGGRVESRGQGVTRSAHQSGASMFAMCVLWLGLAP